MAVKPTVAHGMTVSLPPADEVAGSSSPLSDEDAGPGRALVDRCDRVVAMKGRAILNPMVRHATGLLAHRMTERGAARILWDARLCGGPIFPLHSMNEPE